ncbi:hypothetical protein BH20VER2_BH20VER2_00290 [soil metagenome]|nr:hypothetical protein [Chthoniobacterales bacterium]
MKLFIIALLCAGTFLVVPDSIAANEQRRPAAADREVYGEYPMGYQLIIRNFLKERLLDPESAKISWDSEPKPAKFQQRGKRQLVGYSVNFRVNSRNRFGMYTGNQAYRVLIRNGDVIHVERGSSPQKR